MLLSELIYGSPATGRMVPVLTKATGLWDLGKGKHFWVIEALFFYDDGYTCIYGFAKIPVQFKMGILLR